MKKTIAVIDDDLYVGNMVNEVLNQNGYHVIRAYSGTEAVMLFEKIRPDLVLLDLMLPGMSGEEILPLLQGVPVIVVSARADIGDKVSLLRLGAMDYLTKPFDIDELLARIEVQLRNSVNIPGNVLNVGNMKLDPISHEVFVGDTLIKLTKTEYAILKLFMQNPNTVMAKSTILDHISLDTPDCMESSLKVHVSNLRRKLKEVSGMDNIEAIWGIGFRFNES